MKSFTPKVLFSTSLSFFWIFQKIENFAANSFPSYKMKKNILIEKETEPSILATNKIDQTDWFDQLNKTEVYLIVNESKKQNNLLLIHTQEQLSAQKWMTSRRFNKIFLKSRQKGYRAKNWFDPNTFEISRGLKLSQMVRTNLGSPLAEFFRGGNFYFPENLGGYKSISPIFFDKEAAKIFLADVCEENCEIVRDLPEFTKYQRGTKKEMLKKILQTKIISIGLGDFLNFYLKSSNKESIQKTEFLFFPAYENLSQKSEKKKGVMVETFRSYQNRIAKEAS